MNVEIMKRRLDLEGMQAEIGFSLNENPGKAAVFIGKTACENKVKSEPSCENLAFASTRIHKIIRRCHSSFIIADLMPHEWCF